MQAIFEEKSWVERLRIVFWILVVVGLAIVAVALWRSDDLAVRTKDSYQAVFLENNQVYFGKLRNAGRGLWSLTDVYYLRAGEAQQGTDLIKRGSELHGPKDEMIINKDHVLFYEEIGDDSEVIKKIREHKERN
ncbi:MAG: hypothetical protein U1C57_00400 [Candidatus Doudnabacteria bacterium]|nr:hypothetical protein [bacterium]MDZ4243551.1 hypothetical protein [Candidatus Doudnabacteria bacterium]